MMRLQFVETIKIKDGKVIGLPYHQARLERTIRHFFPSLAVTDMPCLEDVVMAKKDMGFFKARVVYGGDGIEEVSYAPYTMREIRSLKVVEADDIDYSYKSTDRSELNRLAAQKGECDEVIIVKNGLVTDTSFTNLAIYDGKRWLTPKTPLLCGTKRAFLLEKGMIQEADITLEDLKKASKVALFNAMIDLEERIIPRISIF